MNRYPLWKYLLIVAVIAVGLLYALPNLYGEDPAIQISHRDTPVSAALGGEIGTVLDKDHIRYKRIEHEGDTYLVRFYDTEQQLKAIEPLKTALGSRYVVAVNLAPATPKWLRDLSAQPMYLGLDLRGGVHFLLQIDMGAAVEQVLDRDETGMRRFLMAQQIRYTEVSRDKEALYIRFPDATQRDKAETALGTEYTDLTFSPVQRDGVPALAVHMSAAALAETQRYAMEQNITTLRNRVNELGVSEPVIQQQGKDRIVVELPGVQDTARAKDILGATAGLEFRLVSQQGNAANVERTGNLPPNTRLFHERNGSPILLQRHVILTGDYVVNAASGFAQQSNSPAVFITLNAEGAHLMSDATRNNVGRMMAVVYIESKPVTHMVAGKKVVSHQKSEEVINVARIQEQLGKRFQITGLDSPQQARNLSLLLRAGSLAAPMTIIEERTVGPSLGKENIQQGFNSAVIGFLLVVLFMAVYYRIFGLVANLALIANVVLIVAVMSMIQATLTLPGIAGITLTVGMAVDANVLIFERIREELRNGNTPQASIHAGYERAFGTIADSNITTLIAAVMLFAFGSGPVKGFAVTLSIGIVTSMFTAIMGTRAVINLVYGRRRVKSLAI
ncbi:protein-export membrane protein SecD [Acidihalobacter yilgarnensis]|uniref:Protein translocase subunit SecD n=1 Tax=Acidihalobacter yilgarnensis TaxID=2819280 RepID=A0A1D8IP58_9GAMM|nr:protein translocase subunit SecD [Acidihalobacter yilgarnensis]AOU98231.1 protein-export membrane protein SecD [Acidihalobacter yilgarnensis]